MRKDVAVLMVLWVMCIPYATFICASATPNKLDTLKAFLRKKILYDEYVPVDSVICWSENILPTINIIRKSKFPQNPKRSVRFSGKRTKRSVQKRKARNTQKAETKVL